VGLRVGGWVRCGHTHSLVCACLCGGGFTPRTHAHTHTHTHTHTHIHARTHTQTRHVQMKIAKLQKEKNKEKKQEETMAAELASKLKHGLIAHLKHDVDIEVLFFISFLFVFLCFCVF